MEPHTSFNILDLIVLGTILVSGILAAFSGVIRELYSLFNLAASGYIGTHFYRIAEPLVKTHMSNPKVIFYASVFAMFFLSLIVLGVIGMVVRHFLIRGAGLNAIDRSLGFAYGLVRGFAFLSVLYLMGSMFLWPDMDKTPAAPDLSQEEPAHKPNSGGQSFSMSAPHWIAEAKTRPFLAYGAAMLKVLVPEREMEKFTKEYLEKKEEMREQIDSAVANKTNESFFKRQEHRP